MKLKKKMNDLEIYNNKMTIPKQQIDWKFDILL